MVVTIITILASIAIPKISNAIQTSKDGALKGNLGSLRSAVQVYYADNEGNYPSDLAALTVNGKYISALPPITELSHPPSSAVVLGTSSDDTGGWLYNNVSGDANEGGVSINCVHSDHKGLPWTSY